MSELPEGLGVAFARFRRILGFGRIWKMRSPTPTAFDPCRHRGRWIILMITIIIATAIAVIVAATAAMTRITTIA